MNKLLITGGSGFLGSALANWANNWEIYLTQNRSIVTNRNSYSVVDLDIINPSKTVEVLASICPKAIIHTAAIADLKTCEIDKKLAKAVNVEGTRNIAIAARSCGAKLVYVSTDIVYSGKETKYKENDAAEPSCYYGQTKLEAEQIVTQLCPASCIARTALIYGKSLTDKKCFVEVLLDNIVGQKKTATLFSDEYRSPIYIDDLCDALLQMANRDDVRGVFNLGGSHRISRFEFGLVMADVFGFKKESVRSAQIDQNLFAYHRPEDCSMDISKASEVLDKIFLNPQQGLSKMQNDF